MEIRRFTTAESPSGVVTQTDTFLDTAHSDLLGVANIWGFDKVPDLPLRPGHVLGAYQQLGAFGLPGGIRVDSSSSRRRRWPSHNSLYDGRRHHGPCGFLKTPTNATCCESSGPFTSSAIPASKIAWQGRHTYRPASPNQQYSKARTLPERRKPSSRSPRSYTCTASIVSH